MTEREALLRAVCENPDDDTPRLVFADWLQENGDDGDQAQAEFIRAQVESAKLQPHTIPWFKCQRRIEKWKAEYERRWRDDLPSDPAWEYGREFRRGFVESLHVFDFQNFQKHAIRIFGVVPIEVVGFAGELDLSALACVPHLDRVSEIHGQALNCTPDDVRHLIREFRLVRLKRFQLCNGVLSAEARELLKQRFGPVLALVIS